MRELGSLSRLILLSWIVVTLPVAVAIAQTATIRSSAAWANAPSVNPTQTEAIHGVVAEVDSTVTRSVDANVQQWSVGSGTDLPAADVPTTSSVSSTTRALQTSTVTAWWPQYSVIHPQTAKSPVTSTEIMTLTESLSPGPPSEQVATGDVSGTKFPRTSSGIPPSSARARQQQEKRRQQSHEIQKQFLQQCSQLNLAEPECRLRLKGRTSSANDALLQRVKNRETRSHLP